VGVRSLQEHAALLRQAYRGDTGGREAPP
jgi:hypothetical protein